jgi:serine/threonine protein kinase
LLQKLDAIIKRAMEMKPKDRYQSVNELSRDLLSILQALPAITVAPVVNGRAIDPHSTQPDLNEVFEAVQKAAQQANTAQPQLTQYSPVQNNPAPTGATGQPKPSGQASPRCPNCGSELPRKAPYCPVCGSPLNPPPQGGKPGGSAIPGNNQMPKPPRSVSDENTVVIHPSPPRPAQNQLKQTDDIENLPTVKTPPRPSTSTAQRPAFLPAQPTPPVTRASGPYPVVKPVLPPPPKTPDTGQAQSISNNSQAQLHITPSSSMHNQTISKVSSQLLWALIIGGVSLLLVILIVAVFLHSR